MVLQRATKVEAHAFSQIRSGNKKRNGVGAPISLTGRGRGDFGNEN